MPGRKAERTKELILTTWIEISVYEQSTRAYTCEILSATQSR